VTGMNSASSTRTAAVGGGAQPLVLSTGERGISVVEALVTLFFMTVIALSVARMLGVGVEVNRASEDVTVTASLAEQKMEELRSMDYASIAVGGSLTLDVPGFFEEIDANGDAVPDYRRRWQVTDAGVSKTIRVFAISELDAIGDAKRTSLTYLVAAQ